jgi:hypothetical protein
LFSSNIEIERESNLLISLDKEGKMLLNTFLYPDNLTYLIVKICVLILVILLWLFFTPAPVV